LSILLGEETGSTHQGGGGWKGKKALSHANILDDIAIKYLIAGEFVFNVNICYGCDYLL